MQILLLLCPVIIRGVISCYESMHFSLRFRSLRTEIYLRECTRRYCVVGGVMRYQLAVDRPEVHVVPGDSQDISLDRGNVRSVLGRDSAFI